MSEKIIEKTCRYTIPTPEEFYERFRDKVSQAQLPKSWEDSRAWTDSVLAIFDEIGRDFGYVPKKEWFRIDRTWQIRHPDISTIVLALEYENTDSVEEILNDELQKLLDVKAFLKVLMFYPFLSIIEVEGECCYPEIQEKIRSARIKNPNEKYVIMSGVYLRELGAVEFSACIFDPDGKCKNLESFQVKYASET